MDPQPLPTDPKLRQAWKLLPPVQQAGFRRLALRAREEQRQQLLRHRRFLHTCYAAGELPIRKHVTDVTPVTVTDAVTVTESQSSNSDDSDWSSSSSSSSSDSGLDGLDGEQPPPPSD
uniref:Uncharacterized protein n=1 Tax=Eutreptiella gymnastica TaxID=73025 RepID=A0A7S1J1P1_9EUGL